MTRALTHRSTSLPTSDAFVIPTPERYGHGIVERLDRAITDANGAIARPHHVVDTLLAMERRGSISAAMRQAGQDFRRHFATAQLDPLRAVDWSRPRQGGGGRKQGDETGLRIEKAREFVWQTIQAVGGLRSPGGSCLWHVVGCERSLKDWTLDQLWNGRRLSQESASGILIAVLGALDAHFRGPDTLRKSNIYLDKSGSK
jgi:hypothetical protein